MDMHVRACVLLYVNIYIYIYIYMGVGVYAQLDAACVVRALIGCLRVEASALLPTLHAVHALESCCRTFVLVRPRV